MKLTIQQLPQQLAKTLAPIYLISSDEYLLVDESSELIRKTAQQQGYNEHLKLEADAKFDWDTLIITLQTRSLFCEKRIIELHLMTGKPGKTGGKVLQEYAKNPANDVVLLILAPKLESRISQSAWHKAIDKSGITLPLWPIERKQLPQWIKQRSLQAKLNLDTACVKFIADCVEGNLLAAKQEIDKLSLIYGSGTITLEQVQTAMSDYAHYDIFALVDCALEGDKARVLKILSVLKGEGTEPILLLWALCKELRQLARMSFALNQGMTTNTLFQKFYIWPKRKPLVQQALQRQTYRHYFKLIQLAAKIDRIIKGMEPGNCWDELKRLSLRLAS